MSWVWWITRKWPSNCGYSLRMVLKQCGHAVTMVWNLYRLSVSMLPWARVW